MATILELSMALQAIQNLAGLQRDMVNNAAAVKGWCLQGTISANLILPKMIDQANAWLTRIGWITAVTAVPADLTTLTNGIVSLGGNMANASASVTFLINTANAYKTAGQAGATIADAQAGAQALLDTVPKPATVVQ